MFTAVYEIAWVVLARRSAVTFVAVTPALPAGASQAAFYHNWVLARVRRNVTGAVVPPSPPRPAIRTYTLSPSIDIGGT